MLRLGMHSNVMLRFMVQALQDPPLLSSTRFIDTVLTHVSIPLAKINMGIKKLRI
jgi:hypothetical protein